MSPRDAPTGRLSEPRGREPGIKPERFVALGALVLVAVAVVTIFLSSGSTSRRHGSTQTSLAQAKHPTGATSVAYSTTQRQTTTVPILMYHVINVAPPQSAAPPALYVPANEFSSQMEQLKADGWHAVTLDQLEAYWTRGAPLGAGKPIVITFDTGYASQYTNALPVLKRLGWVAVENLVVNGLSPSDGGLTDSQIRGLIGAGWELDTQGMSHADLITLDPTALGSEVSTARQTLQTRYGVPVNWFSYPFGHYDANVIAAVHAGGFIGSTTATAGWASAQQDRFRLPRIQVVGGTSPSQLLAQIDSAKSNPQPPATYSGAGSA